jgi:acyl CoA:acetate/3-ketoacid CoA transferase beta subunit
MPTTSLTGSDMAADLAAQGGYATATNPFSGEDVGVIAPLAPDVTFVHGLAADTAGNVLVCPPYYDAKWAALAAKRAVIATVETIVSPETIRRHAALVQIPAERITCVCEMPLGGHPNSVPGDLVPEVGGYTDDYDFLTDLRSAGATGEALDEWTAEWITGCPNHEAYLARLGSRRINELRGRARADGWQFELGELAAERKGTPASEAERHVVLATRALTERLSSGNLDAILAGLGVSSLAAWMAAIRMRENGHPIPLMVEAGMYGYLPAPADPFLFNYRNMFSGSMLSDVATILGVMTGGPGNRSIGVLGAAQVDRAGNLNTSRLPNLLLTGSGGANDIASSASEVVVTIGESPKRLVEKVDFITSPGRAVRMVVTPSAVFERRDADYVLTRAMPTPEENLAAAVERIRGRCSWAFECADDLVEEVEPDADEIELARLLDPQGLFLG